MNVHNAIRETLRNDWLSVEQLVTLLVAFDEHEVHDAISEMASLQMLIIDDRFRVCVAR